MPFEVFFQRVLPLPLKGWPPLVYDHCTCEMLMFVNSWIENCIYLLIFTIYIVLIWTWSLQFVIEKEVEQISIHSQFVRGKAYYDVAVLAISEIQFSAAVRPICLPGSTSEDGSEYDDRAATVTGWGSENLNRSTSAELKRAQVEIYDIQWVIFLSVRCHKELLFAKQN